MSDLTATRRRFLASAASVPLAAAEIRPSLPVRKAARPVSANDRIRVGMIGVGIMGADHLRSFVQQQQQDKDIEVAAVADVYKRHRDRAKAITNLDDKHIVVDYREILQRDDIDCVLIATPDHWHAQMAIDAFAAGKDVYLQKPITLTVEESAQVVAACARHGRVLQVGSQFLSDPRWHKARELIQSGAIGDVLWAQTTYSRNSKSGEWNYYVDEECTPETVDWKRWLGPAPKVPFSGERFFRWRKYWAYSNGVSSDLYYHRLGPILFAIGGQYPTRVTGAGGIYIQKDREVPDTFINTIEYEKCSVVIAGSMANAAANRFMPEAIYGHTGTIVVEPTRVVVYPERLDRRAPGNGAGEQVFEFPEGARNNNRLHTDNFFSCMRTRKTPVLGPELAHQIMTAIGLACESYREGQLKLFDPATRKRIKTAAKRPMYEGDGKNYPEGPRKQPAA
jgi:predicted dehydrogenase